MNSLNELSKREPLTRNAAIGAILTTILVWLRTMGYIEWTEEQFAVTEELVLMLVDAAIWIVLLLQPRFAREITPTAYPKSKDGEQMLSSSQVAKLIDQTASQNTKVMQDDPELIGE